MIIRFGVVVDVDPELSVKMLNWDGLEGHWKFCQLSVMRGSLTT